MILTMFISEFREAARGLSPEAGRWGARARRLTAKRAPGSMGNLARRNRFPEMFEDFCKNKACISEPGDGKKLSCGRGERDQVPAAPSARFSRLPSLGQHEVLGAPRVEPFTITSLLLLLYNVYSYYYYYYCYCYY